MNAKMLRRAGVAMPRSDHSALHDLSGTALMTSLEHTLGDDELKRLQDRVLLGFQELEPRLRGMIEKRIAPRLKGRIDVDVVVQNALSELLASLVTRRPKSDAELSAWIFKRTWSRWQDELRRWRTEARNIDREVPLESGSDVALVGGIGIATKFGLKETVERIREALSAVDFRIVELRIVDELSYVELSKLLGLSPESIRKRFTRALLKIRHVVTSPFSSAP